MATKTKKTAKRAAASKAQRSTKVKGGKPARKMPAVKRAKAKTSRDGKLSALDAALKVLSESNEPMGCRQMIEAMATRGYWTSPAGKTPHATLYAAILRETQQKGRDSRFRKTDRGRFALAKA